MSIKSVDDFVFCLIFPYLSSVNFFYQLKTKKLENLALTPYINDDSLLEMYRCCFLDG